MRAGLPVESFVVSLIGLYLVGVLLFLWQPISADRNDRAILALSWPIMTLLLVCSLPFVVWDAAKWHRLIRRERGNQ